MKIELTEEQIEEIFVEKMYVIDFKEIAAIFDDDDEIIKYLKDKGYALVKPKFDQAINSYALKAFQDALNRGVDPFKIEETLNNLK